MTHYYLDASALVKYYVLEPGSTWVRACAGTVDAQTGQNANTLSIADISIAETTAAFAVLYRTGRIHRGMWHGVYDLFIADLIHRWLVVETGRPDFAAAAALTRKHPLKGYDAVQLAVALRYRTILDSLQIKLTFVSGDRTLLAAGASEGLHIDNPFDHGSSLDVASPV